MSSGNGCVSLGVGSKLLEKSVYVAEKSGLKLTARA